MFLTYVFEAFTEASSVCYCYVISSDVGLVFVVSSILILVVVSFFLCKKHGIQVYFRGGETTLLK